MSNLTDHAKYELQLARAFSADAPYGGMIGDAVLELVECFAKQGHSGMSAGIVLDMFVQLAAFKPLSELTSDPAEWNDVSEVSGMVKDSMWQSRRRPDAFSKDHGHTYYLVDKPDEFFAAVAPAPTA